MNYLFHIAILLHEIKWNNKPIAYCKWYQENCRIYLDEYEVEEVDLRVNFDTSLLMKRFLKRS